MSACDVTARFDRWNGIVSEAAFDNGQRPVSSLKEGKNRCLQITTKKIVKPSLTTRWLCNSLFAGYPAISVTQINVQIKMLIIGIVVSFTSINSKSDATDYCYATSYINSRYLICLHSWATVAHFISLSGYRPTTLWWYDQQGNLATASYCSWVFTFWRARVNDCQDAAALLL